MATIIGIAGSLRRGSYNTALLRAAKELSPVTAHIEIASIAGIPLYDGDVEAEHGVPDKVAELKNQIFESDGLLFVTPEYNQSMPGVLKNAIDWLSRPAKDTPRVFVDKPIAVIGATPGTGGTRLAQGSLLPMLRALGTRPWWGRQLYVAAAAQVFDPEGRLMDDVVRKLLTEFLSGFAAFVNGK